MKQLLTQGIVLSRTDYGEADRIITVLTPEHGKLRLMARGVRKVKSKLAGGIELFSVSDLTYITGKGDIGTLISSRLNKHYGKIIHDIDRVQLGYELIKLLNKATEDQPEPEYFRLLEQAYEALDDAAIEQNLIRSWLQTQMLKLAGHTPNLQTDTDGQPLQADQKYSFDYEAMIFAASPKGNFQADHIKTLRLLFDSHPPSKLQQVQGLTDTLGSLSPHIKTMFSSHIRV